MTLWLVLSPSYVGSKLCTFGFRMKVNERHEVIEMYRELSCVENILNRLRGNKRKKRGGNDLK